MTDTRPRLTFWEIALYCAALFVVWTFREFFMRQPVADRVGELSSALIGTATKLLVWTVPALFFVRRYRADMAIPDLFHHPIEWSTLLTWMVALLAYNIVLARVTFGVLRVRAGFSPVSLIGTVLFVGITEETVFRGFLLNTFLTRMHTVLALCLSSILFVLIHFPIWLMKGLFAVPLDVARSCLAIFILGMIFGLSFLRDRNLLSPILLHMTWNLASTLFFG